MINIIAYCLIEKLLERNKTIFTDSTPRFIGHQNSKGQVLYGDKFFEYIGLTDKKGNYFYIRQAAEKNNFNRSTDKFDSGAFNYSVSIPLKLVVVFKDLNTELFHYKILNDLLGINVAAIDHKRRPALEMIDSCTDFETIFQEETGKSIEGHQWNGSTKLMSYDMNLRFQIEYDPCLTLSCLCADLGYDDFVLLKQECKTVDAILAKMNSLINP